ncbi:MAG: AsnC family transcriptional regulator [Candidatus Micrarchaeota archaeon]|nr:AsnC family transcriptional regulator [Candidatus Micrarchaeota archaeon]
MKVYEYSYVKRAMLRELSEDSRISVTKLAKKLGCSRTTVINNLKTMEKEFGIRYTIEFNKKPLGIAHNQILAIKFGVKPKPQELEEIFKDDDMLRLAAVTEGDFDLLINMVSQSNEEYIYWGLRTTLKLLKYRPTIKPSFIAMSHTGYIPLTNATLKRFISNNKALDRLDRELLLQLNGDARLSHVALAKKLGSSVETIRYRFRKLSKSGLVKRYTITLDVPQSGYTTAFFMNYEFAPGIMSRSEKAREYYIGLDDKLPFINSFQFLALCSGSFLLFGLGHFDNEGSAIKNTIIAHKEIYKENNPTLSTGRIVKVIKGDVPIRNIDLAKDYNSVNWDSFRGIWGK